MKIPVGHLVKYRFLYVVVGVVMLVSFQNCSPNSVRTLSSSSGSLGNGDTSNSADDDVSLSSNPEFHYALQETYLHGQMTSNNITALYIDGSNYLIGTNFDLAVSVNGGSTWQSFTANDGLTGQTIYSIQKIGAGLFLIGHNHGTSLFDLSQMKILTGTNQVYSDQATLNARGLYYNDLALKNDCAYYLTASKGLVKTCYSGSVFTSQTLLTAALPSGALSGCLKATGVDFFNNDIFINCDGGYGYISSDDGQTFSKVSYPTNYNDVQTLNNFALAIPTSPSLGCELVYFLNSIGGTPTCLSLPSATYGTPSKIRVGPSYFWMNTNQGIVTVNLNHQIQFYQHPTTGLYVNGFALTADHSFLATSSFGLISRNLSNQSIQRFNNSTLNVDIDFQKVLNLGDGDFVLGSNYGYYSFSANTGHVDHINNKYSLSNWNSYVNMNSASNQIYQVGQIDQAIVGSQNSSVQYTTDSSGNTITDLKSFGLMQVFDRSNLKIKSLGYLSRNIDLSPESYFIDGNDIIAYLAADKAVAKFSREQMYTDGADLNDLSSKLILKVSNASNDYFYGYGQLYNDSANDKYYVWFPAPSSGKPTQIYKWNFNTKTFDLYSTAVASGGGSIYTTDFAIHHPVLFNNKIYFSSGIGYSNAIDIQPGTSTVTNLDTLKSNCPQGSSIDFLDRSKNYLHYSCSIAGTNSKYIYVGRNGQAHIITPTWIVSPFAFSDVYGVTEYKSGFYITGYNFGLIDLH